MPDAKPRAPRRSPSAVDQGLGARLRFARESKQVGVRELARRIGVSASLISQIETGKSDPSVTTLMAIVTELDLPVSEMVFGAREQPARKAAPARAAVTSPMPVSHALRAVQSAQPPWESGHDDVTTPVQRASNRRVIDLEQGVHWERLTSAADLSVDFLKIRYEPGGTSTPSGVLMRHNGREYGYVLSGRLRVTIAFNSYELGPGDSVAFDSTTPHGLETIGDIPVEAIWIVVGRQEP